MAAYFFYQPCPGCDPSVQPWSSNATKNFDIDGLVIQFPDGDDPDCCFLVSTVELEIPPAGVVTIDWNDNPPNFNTFVDCETCENTLNPPCGECPPGYDLVNGECILIEEVPAEYSGGLVTIEKAAQVTSYSKFGLRLYPDITSLPLPIYGNGTSNSNYAVIDDNGAGSTLVPTNNVQSELWGADIASGCYTGSVGGKLNTSGIWSTGYPDNQELSFDFCVELQASKQYLIGIAGDNKVKIYVDGVLHVFLDAPSQSVTRPFNHWHVFPITLSPGQHIIRLSGLNLGSQGAFGAEIYDIPASQLISDFTTPCGNGANDLDPFTIFSTGDYVGQQIPDPEQPGEWTCPDGSVLDTCNVIPTCRIESKTNFTPCCFRLDPCDGGDSIYTQTDLTEFTNVDVVLELDGYEGCWTVTEVEECINPFPVTVVDSSKTSCLECNPGYQLRDCKNPENIIYTQTDLSQYLDSGEVIQISEYPGFCFQVFQPEVAVPSPQDVTPTIAYSSCEECDLTQYLLQDCQGQEPDIVTNTDLSAYVGQVVSLDFCPDVCWTVVEAPQLSPTPQLVIVESSYVDCESCYPEPEPEPEVTYKHRSVQPGYCTPGCSPEYYEKVMCKFADALYKKMVEIRYGITMCCQETLDKIRRDKEILNYKVLETPCDGLAILPKCESYVVDEPPLAGTSFSVTYKDCTGKLITFTENIGEGGNCYQFCAWPNPQPVVVRTGLVNDSRTLDPIRECTDNDAEICYGAGLAVTGGEGSATITYINCAGEETVLTADNLVSGDFVEFCIASGTEESIIVTGDVEGKVQIGNGEGGDSTAKCRC